MKIVNDCIFGHKWTKWELYDWVGVVYPGRIAPESMQGKPVEVSEKRQRRHCEKCGYNQDVLVAG